MFKVNQILEIKNFSLIYGFNNGLKKKLDKMPLI